MTSRSGSPLVVQRFRDEKSSRQKLLDLSAIINRKKIEEAVRSELIFTEVDAIK